MIRYPSKKIIKLKCSTYPFFEVISFCVGVFSFDYAPVFCFYCPTLSSEFDRAVDQFLILFFSAVIYPRLVFAWVFAVAAAVVTGSRPGIQFFSSDF